MRLNSAQFLLPQSVVLRVDYDDGSESENRTVFSACHEFLGQSKLSFDTQTSSPPLEAIERSAPQPLTIPVGLHFTLALARPVETESAAAGDTITATLTTPLADEQNNVVIPKGATVTGRIVQIKRLYGPHSFVVAIRLETIERDGIAQPFSAQLARVVKRSSDSFIHLSRLVKRQNLGSFDQMQELEAPDVGILRFEDVNKDYVIPRGLRLEGTTSAQQP